MYNIINEQAQSKAMFTYAEPTFFALISGKKYKINNKSAKACTVKDVFAFILTFIFIFTLLHWNKCLQESTWKV